MRKNLFIALSFCCLLLTGSLGKPLLPYTPAMPPLILLPASQANIEDGRGRFREIWCAVRKDHGSKSCPATAPVKRRSFASRASPRRRGSPSCSSRRSSSSDSSLSPGSTATASRPARPFPTPVIAHIERLGYRAADLAVSGWSSSAHNARMIRDALLAADLARQERAVLIGYSKGAPDILQALVEYPEIVGKVAAVVAIAGAVGGTPLTDSMGELEKKIMAKNPIVTCPPGVGDPIASLQRSTRQLWLSQNRLPPWVRYFSLVTFADRENVSTVLLVNYDRLAQVSSPPSSTTRFRSGGSRPQIP